MNPPFRASFDPVSGDVLLVDHRPKSPTLQDMLTPDAAQVLLMDLEIARNQYLLHRALKPRKAATPRPKAK